MSKKFSVGMDMVGKLNQGIVLHRDTLREMLLIYEPDTMVNVDDGKVCTELAARLDEYPVWEPEEDGMHATRERAAHLYAMLNYAYKAGRSAAKADVANKVADMIYKAGSI